LEKSQAAAAAFQVVSAAAKVEALQQQGLAEVARTDANVMQAQMKQAVADAAQYHSKLDQSAILVTDLQSKLALADTEIERLQTLAAKR
jgi:hypothetical protein